VILGTNQTYGPLRDRHGFTRETSRNIIQLFVVICLCCFFCFIPDVVSFGFTGAFLNCFFLNAVLLLEILALSVLGII